MCGVWGRKRGEWFVFWFKEEKGCVVRLQGGRVWWLEEKRVCGIVATSFLGCLFWRRKRISRTPKEAREKHPLFFLICSFCSFQNFHEGVPMGRTRVNGLMVQVWNWERYSIMIGGAVYVHCWLVSFTQLVTFTIYTTVY